MGPKVLGLAATAAFVVAAGGARADAIDAYLQNARAKAHVPAVAVAVVRDGKVVKLAAYGQANIEDAARATPDSAFALASGTKFFTGILTMRMVEAGKLSLGERIDRYLDGLPPAWRGVTVAQLAAHTSGIPDAMALKSPVSDEAALIAALKDAPMAYPPGERSEYNQTEFALLKAILEKVSGRPLDRLLDDEIVRPLGLTATRYANLSETPAIMGSTIRTGDPILGKAPLYIWEGGRQRTMEFLFPSWAYTAAGLFSSAADLAKVMAALETGRLLSPASMKALETPYRLNNGRDGGFAVAWVVRRWRGRLAVGHSGGPAYSDIWLQPERGLAVAVLTDQQNFGPVLADGVARIVDPAPAPTRVAVADHDPAVSARLLIWARELSQGRMGRGLLAHPDDAGAAMEAAEVAPALALSPALEGWTLIGSESGPGGARTRTYAARHGGDAYVWTFYLDPAGKIAGYGVVPE